MIYKHMIFKTLLVESIHHLAVMLAVGESHTSPRARRRLIRSRGPVRAEKKGQADCRQRKDIPDAEHTYAVEPHVVPQSDPLDHEFLEHHPAIEEGNKYGCLND
jgi:hypothetical protein